MLRGTDGHSGKHEQKQEQCSPDEEKEQVQIDEMINSLVQHYEELGWPLRSSSVSYTHLTLPTKA